MVAALEGNAGAGGVPLALAADLVWTRPGVVLNPHYQGMGGLYGSEYWTYLLPRRVGARLAAALTEDLLPVAPPEARAMGLIDAAFGATPADFLRRVEAQAHDLASGPRYAARRREKATGAGATRPCGPWPPTASRSWPACTAASTAPTRPTTRRAGASCTSSRRPPRAPCGGSPAPPAPGGRAGRPGGARVGGRRRGRLAARQRHARARGRPGTRGCRSSLLRLWRAAPRYPWRASPAEHGDGRGARPFATVDGPPRRAFPLRHR